MLRMHLLLRRELRGLGTDKGLAREISEIIIKECLVIVSAQSQKQIYQTELHGKIALEASSCNGSSFEKVFVPDGFKMPICEYSSNIQFEYWKNGSTWNSVIPDHLV